MPLKIIKSILKEISNQLKESTPKSVYNAVILMDKYVEPGWWIKRKLRRTFSKIKTDLKGLVNEQILKILELQIYIFKQGEYEINLFGEEIRKLSRSRQIFNVNINKLRFYQDYVQNEEIKRKEKYLTQLKRTYGAFNNNDPELDLALKEVPYTLPIIVSNIYGTDLYVVHNGAHTVYTYHKHGLKKVEAALDSGRPISKNKENYLKINELRLE